MSNEKIERIEKVVNKSIESTPAADYDQAIAPDKERFDQLMTEASNKSNDLVASNEKIRLNQTDPLNTQNLNTENTISTKRNRPTAIEESSEIGQINKISQTSKTSIDEVIAKADQIISKMDEVKTTLAKDPNLPLSGPVQDVLHSHLKHIDENLQLALKRTGSEYKEPEGITSLATPIERFLGMLTRSQSQLDNMGSDLSKMGLMGKELSPASMLAVQIKVNQVSQEVEFFANILSKTLDSIKTIMNVQV